MYQKRQEKALRKKASIKNAQIHSVGQAKEPPDRKRLREIGFSNVWFAILEGIVVTSGLTRDGVEQILQEIIPAEKRELVYVFHLRK